MDNLQQTRSILDADLQETAVLRQRLSNLKGRMECLRAYYDTTKGHSYLREHHIKKLAEEVASAEADVVAASKMPSWRDALVSRRRLQQSSSLTSDSRVVETSDSLLAVTTAFTSVWRSRSTTTQDGAVDAVCVLGDHELDFIQLLVCSQQDVAVLSRFLCSPECPIELVAPILSRTPAPLLELFDPVHAEILSRRSIHLHHYESLRAICTLVPYRSLFRSLASPAADLLIVEDTPISAHQHSTTTTSLEGSLYLLRSLAMGFVEPLHKLMLNPSLVLGVGAGRDTSLIRHHLEPQQAVPSPLGFLGSTIPPMDQFQSKRVIDRLLDISADYDTQVVQLPPRIFHFLLHLGNRACLRDQRAEEVIHSTSHAHTPHKGSTPSNPIATDTPYSYHGDLAVAQFEAMRSIERTLHSLVETLPSEDGHRATPTLRLESIDDIRFTLEDAIRPFLTEGTSFGAINTSSTDQDSHKEAYGADLAARLVAPGTQRVSPYWMGDPLKDIFLGPRLVGCYGSHTTQLASRSTVHVLRPAHVPPQSAAPKTDAQSNSKTPGKTPMKPSMLRTGRPNRQHSAPKELAEKQAAEAAAALVKAREEHIRSAFEASQRERYAPFFADTAVYQGRKCFSVRIPVNLLCQGEVREHVPDDVRHYGNHVRIGWCTHGFKSARMEHRHPHVDRFPTTSIDTDHTIPTFPSPHPSQLGEDASGLGISIVPIENVASWIQQRDGREVSKYYTSPSQREEAFEDCVAHASLNSPPRFRHTFEQQPESGLHTPPRSVTANDDTPHYRSFAVLKHTSGVAHYYKTNPHTILRIPTSQEYVEVTCGVDFISGEVHYMVDGLDYGAAFDGLVRAKVFSSEDGLYPCVSLPVLHSRTPQTSSSRLGRSVKLTGSSEANSPGSPSLATAFNDHGSFIRDAPELYAVDVQLHSDPPLCFKTKGFTSLNYQDKVRHMIGAVLTYVARLTVLRDSVTPETSLKGRLTPLQTHIDALLTTHVTPLLNELEVLPPHRVPIIPDVDTLATEAADDNELEHNVKSLLPHCPEVFEVAVAPGASAVHKKDELLAHDDTFACDVRAVVGDVGNWGRIEGLSSRLPPSCRARLLTARVRAQKAPPLAAAIHLHQLDVAMALTQLPLCNVNIPDEQGNTPLMLATLYGHPTLVHALLYDRDAAATPINYSGYTVLHIALLTGQLECLDVLLSHPTAIDLNVINCTTATKSNAVLLTVKLQQHKYLDILLERGGDPAKADTNNVHSLLHALRFGDTAAIASILKYKSRFTPTDVNCRERKGERGTCLLRAAAVGDAEVCDMLLTMGSQHHLYFEHNRCNALHSALIANNDDCASIILRHVVQRHEDAENQASTRASIDLTSPTPVAQLSTFLETTETKFGMTALHLACDRGLWKTALLLVASTANVCAQDKTGLTPLMMAAMGNAASHSDGACAFIGAAKKRLKVNQVDKNGNTALILAAQNGLEEVVTSLIDTCRADVNVVNAAGLSALTAAIRSGHQGCAEIILHLSGMRVNLGPSDSVASPAELAHSKGLYRLARTIVGIGGVCDPTTRISIDTQYEQQIQLGTELSRPDLGSRLPMSQSGSMRKVNRVYLSETAALPAAILFTLADPPIHRLLKHIGKVLSATKAAAQGTVAPSLSTSQPAPGLSMHERMAIVLLNATPTGEDAIKVLESLDMNSCTGSESGSSSSVATTPMGASLAPPAASLNRAVGRGGVVTLDDDPLFVGGKDADPIAPSQSHQPIIASYMAQSDIVAALIPLFASVSRAVATEKNMRLAAVSVLKLLHHQRRASHSTSFDPLSPAAYEWELPRGEALAFSALLTRVGDDCLTTLRAIVGNRTTFNPNATTRSKWEGRNCSLLHIALLRDNVGAFRFLLSLGAELPRQCNTLKAPLFSTQSYLESGLAHGLSGMLLTLLEGHAPTRSPTSTIAQGKAPRGLDIHIPSALVCTLRHRNPAFLRTALEVAPNAFHEGTVQIVGGPQAALGYSSTIVEAIRNACLPDSLVIDVASAAQQKACSIEANKMNIADPIAGLTPLQAAVVVGRGAVVQWAIHSFQITIGGNARLPLGGSLLVHWGGAIPQGLSLVSVTPTTLLPLALERCDTVVHPLMDFGFAPGPPTEDGSNDPSEAITFFGEVLSSFCGEWAELDRERNLMHDAVVEFSTSFLSSKIAASSALPIAVTATTRVPQGSPDASLTDLPDSALQRRRSRRRTTTSVCSDDHHAPQRTRVETLRAIAAAVLHEHILGNSDTTLAALSWKHPTSGASISHLLAQSGQLHLCVSLLTALRTILYTNSSQNPGSRFLEILHAVDAEGLSVLDYLASNWYTSDSEESFGRLLQLLTSTFLRQGFVESVAPRCHPSLLVSAVLKFGCLLGDFSLSGTMQQEYESSAAYRQATRKHHHVTPANAGTRKKSIVSLRGASGLFHHFGVDPAPEEGGAAAQLLWYGLVFTSSHEEWMVTLPSKRYSLRYPMLLCCPPHVFALLCGLCTTIPSNLLAGRVDARVSNLEAAVKALSLRPPWEDAIYNRECLPHNLPWRRSQYYDLPFFVRQRRVWDSMERPSTSQKVPRAQSSSPRAHHTPRKPESLSNQVPSIFDLDALLGKVLVAVCEGALFLGEGEERVSTAGIKPSEGDVVLGEVVPLSLEDWLLRVSHSMAASGSAEGFLTLRTCLATSFAARSPDAPSASAASDRGGGKVGGKGTTSVTASTPQPQVDPVVHRFGIFSTRILAPRAVVITAARLRRPEMLYCLVCDDRHAGLKGKIGQAVMDSCAEGIDLRHASVFHQQCMATCIRILLFARYTIGPLSLAAIRAVPQYLSVGYITPLHKDSLLHIASMRGDTTTIDSLLTDPRFDHALSRNAFGLRAWEYAATPTVMSEILAGAVRSANRMFKTKELMAHRENVRSVLDEVKNRRLKEGSLSTAAAKVLERLSGDVKHSQHLAQGGASSLSASARGGGDTNRMGQSTAAVMANTDNAKDLRDVLEEHLAGSISDDSVVDDVMEAVHRGADALDNKLAPQRSAFNSLLMLDGSGQPLIRFPVCIVSSRFLSDTLSAQYRKGSQISEILGLAQSLTQVLSKTKFQPPSEAEASLNHAGAATVAVTAQLMKSLVEDAGLLIECEDAFGNITPYSEKVVLARVYMPAVIQGQLVVQGIYDSNPPLSFLLASTRSAVHRGLTIRASTDYLRFTYPYEYGVVGGSQSELLINGYLSKMGATVNANFFPANYLIKEVSKHHDANNPTGNDTGASEGKVAAVTKGPAHASPLKGSMMLGGDTLVSPNNFALAPLYEGTAADETAAPKGSDVPAIVLEAQALSLLVHV